MKSAFLFILFMLLSLIFVQGQKITEEIPFSLTQSSKSIPNSYKIKALDLNKVYYEDSVQLAKYQQFNIARFQEFQIGLLRNENKEYLSESKIIWRQKVQVPNAKSLALKFKNLFLPKGSRLYIYSENQESDFLVFDASDKDINQAYFISKKINGEILVLEYNQLETTSNQANIDIEGLVNYYEKQTDANPGFGQSTDCEVNVVCSEGEGWCNESQSVVRVFIQSGSNYSYCTGSVVNNTTQDFTPYILTAEHCGAYATDEDFKYWKFDFNYQSYNCTSPSSESEIFSNSISGCEQIAKARRETTTGSDFRLLRLLDSIPQAWNIYYAGWDVEEYNTISGGGVSIHHPYGDIKKISTYTQDLTSTDAFGENVNDEYWKTYWIETENGHGITEGGSSGSPIFNNVGLIIGTLATGSSYCDNRKTDPDFYGKMARHWDNNGVDSTRQLKVWLDPINLGVKQLGGLPGNKNIECGEKLSFEDFTIYPNPANANIKIGNDNLFYLSNAILEIYDIRGRLILTKQTDLIIGVKKVDVSSLSEGVYVLKVIQTGWVIQQKFVILR